MKFAVVVFPGSNCDVDCFHVAKEVLGQPTEYVWHASQDLGGADCVLLPVAFPTATTCAPAPLPAFRR